MANTSGRPICQLEVVVDVGGLHLGLDMAIIVLIHAVHGFDLRMECKGSKGEGRQTRDYLQSRGEEIYL